MNWSYAEYATALKITASIAQHLRERIDVVTEASNISNLNEQQISDLLAVAEHIETLHNNVATFCQYDEKNLLAEIQQPF